jgi:hypothetical protein
MSDAIITVSNLGKKYRIKHNAERQRYTALRDVLANKVKGLFQNRKSEIGGGLLGLARRFLRGQTRGSGGTYWPERGGEEHLIKNIEPHH